MINNISILKGITILYAEDEASLREITLNILKGFTKKQFVAKDGAEGLDLFKTNQDEIDLIITDVNMPKMNGLEMIKEIKSINPNIPIIVATAFSNTEYLLEAIDIGVDKYVLKPIDMKKLLQIMSQSLLYHELKELYIDKLTNLANRNRLKKDLASSAQNLLALVNIDKFSTINDVFGENNGDKILFALSKQIKKDFDKNNFKIYRVESDKFVILSKDVDLDINEFKNMCSEFVENVEKSPIKIDETDVDLRVTVGIAQGDASTAYKYAQRVVHYARIKLEPILIYDDTLNIQEDFQENMKWVKNVKKGIENDLFTAYFQPIVNSKTQEVYKYEALIRYMDGDTPIAPFKFLEISKKIKLYYKIIEIMLDKAINLIKNKNKRVSVNISFADITNISTRDHIISKLEENKEYTTMLEFEILESEEISDFQAVRNFIKDVKEYGCSVGVDDFGAGYSNFNMLTNLDIDFVKIDGSLIKEIDKSKNQEIIVETIASFSKKFGFKTVAEFVSSQAIYEKINSIGIDYSQGYHFGKPISYAEIS